MRTIWNLVVLLFKVAVALATSAFSWWVYLQIALSLQLPRPHFLASALLISVAVHEMGHMIAFIRHGVPCAFFILVVMGGTVPLSKEKLEALPDNASAEIALAGMFGNMLVAAVAIVGYYIGAVSEDSAGRLINMNASLMLFNMIPLVIFDGARFVKVLFHNISKKYARLIFEITSIPVIFGMMLLLYYRGSIVMALPLILVGLGRSMDKTDNGGLSTKEMTVVDRIVWAIVYTYIVCVALIGFVLSPNWDHH